MSLYRVLDLMIDSVLFGESLSTFTKRNFEGVKQYKCGELCHLWKTAQERAYVLLYR